MKNFLLYIASLLLLTIILAYFCDFVGTYAFTHTKGRGKINFIYNSEKLEYDVIALGSSRAENHFANNPFLERKISFFNYGMSGSNLMESSLMLKLMIERGWKIKTVLLQVDSNIAGEGSNGKITAMFLPYLNESKIIQEHLSSLEDYSELRMIPFYRYIKYGSVIGFRQLALAFAQKKSTVLENYGYAPLSEIGRDLKGSVDVKAQHNRYYDEIKRICKDNNIRLEALTTPMCENASNYNFFLETLNKIYPEIKRYEKVINGDTYFSSCGHMNDLGANKFTNIIIEDLILKNRKAKNIIIR